MFEHLVLELYRNLQCLFQATARTANKNKSFEARQCYHRGIFAMVLM